jgi:hypothetical protein
MLLVGIDGYKNGRIAAKDDGYSIHVEAIEEDLHRNPLIYG